MTDLHVPVLGYSSQGAKSSPEVERRLIVGVADLTLDGKPFPWATVGDWMVKFGVDQLATLTVTIPVSLPPDPEAPA